MSLTCVESGAHSLNHSRSVLQFINGRLDTMRAQSCGRRHMYPPSFVPFSTPMIQHTFLTRIASLILSRPQKVNSAFCKPLKFCFQKVRTYNFTLTCLLMFLQPGWQVGSDPEIQVATVVSNHLTAGIMKYFGDSGRWQQAANLFEKLAVREPEVNSLLARSYIGMSACASLAAVGAC